MNRLVRNMHLLQQASDVLKRLVIMRDDVLEGKQGDRYCNTKFHHVHDEHSCQETRDLSSETYL